MDPSTNCGWAALIYSNIYFTEQSRLITAQFESEGRLDVLYVWRDTSAREGEEEEENRGEQASCSETQDEQGKGTSLAALFFGGDDNY